MASAERRIDTEEMPQVRLRRVVAIIRSSAWAVLVPCYQYTRATLGLFDPSSRDAGEPEPMTRPTRVLATYRSCTVVLTVPPLRAEYCTVMAPEPRTRYSTVRVVRPA